MKSNRLSPEQYASFVQELYQEHHKNPEPELAQKQLNLTIDHRLGLDFPPERRAQLWAVQENVEKNRLKLAALWASKKINMFQLEANSAENANFVMSEYSKVLTIPEMREFFGPPDSKLTSQNTDNETLKVEHETEPAGTSALATKKKISP